MSAKAKAKSTVGSKAKASGKKSKTVKKVAKKSVAKKASKATGKASVAYRLNIGDAAPKAKMMTSSGKTLTIGEFKGRKLVLYFYPKDNTPGCTLEGYDFKKYHKDFLNEGCEILGISRDSAKSHTNFKEKCGFPFELIVDEEGELCRAFDVIQMKSLYGRKFEGIERSTFVIDENGRVLRDWRKVKVPGHVSEVLDFVREN